MKRDALDIFGQFIINNLFDKGLERYFDLKNNKFKSSSSIEISNCLQNLTKTQTDLIEKMTNEVLVTAVHDFLFSVQESDEIKIIVNGIDVAEESDGLHGELFTTEGWIHLFSKAAK